MIICRQCGAESDEDDDFCGSCGVFLEWEGERVATEPAPEPEAEPDPEPEHKPTLIERVKTVIGIDEEHAPRPPGEGEVSAPAAAPDTPAEHVEPAATSRPAEPVVAAAAAPPADVAPPAPIKAPAAVPPPPVDVPVPASPATKPASAADSRAAALVAKQRATAQPEPARAQPVAQQPAAPRRPPRAPAPPMRKRELRPGDLVCGECGEGNDPARKFCRRCGTSLAQAETVQVPWWRRLWAWLTRSRKKTVAAGDRPARWGAGPRQRPGAGLGRTLRRLVALLIPLLVLAGFVGPFRPSIRSAARAVSSPVLDRIRPPQDPVRAVSVTASSTAPGHVPESAIDGVRTTHWSEGAPGNGEGQGLVVNFDGEVDLSRIGFTLGGSPDPADFQSHPRPKELHLVFSNGKTADVTLKDMADFQRVKVSAKKVTSVQLQILSVYPSLQGSSECSFAEIEFFGRT